MNQTLTTAIVLSRTNYGEADKIVTLLTPDHGKIRVMAKGVRKVKSRLAGAIELFSVSEIGYIKGKGDLHTLISARLVKHYGNIVKDLRRVQLGYDLIKILNRATEDETEESYFAMLDEAFAALDDDAIPTELIGLWFRARLLREAGHMPNLLSDVNGEELAPDERYEFDYDTVAFAAHSEGHFTSSHIKTLRILFSNNPPATINRIAGVGNLLVDLEPLMRLLMANYIRA